MGDLLHELQYRRGSTGEIFEPLGGSLASGIAVVSHSTDHLQLFTVGADNEVYTR